MAGNIGIEYASALTCVYPPCFYLPHFYSLHFYPSRFHPPRLTYCYVNARGVENSFITDATGTAIQHLEYLPFGETFVDQQNGYKSRYTFSAKEKDDETQYSYFGARYYDSDLSVWLSVDPMAYKYPSMSSYMYCAGNPVMLVDPNGMEIDPTRTEGMNFFVTSTKKTRQEDRQAEGGGVKGFFKSALTWDYIKAKTMSIMSFGKLKVIEAENSKDAESQINNKLGSNGYIANMTIDYHAGRFGGEGTKFDDAKSMFENFAAEGKLGLSRDGSTKASNIYLGGCWMGGNPSYYGGRDYTTDVTKWSEGATVFGNKAASSAYHFVINNSFIGVFPASYSQSQSNRNYVGHHSISSGEYGKNGELIITTNSYYELIRIKNGGRITF